mgnify:CR=1 FL=1
MARQKRILSLDEQLTKVISDIKLTEKTLQELRETKKDIEEKIRVRNMEELDALIVQSGKSYEEIKALLMGYGEKKK